MRGAIIKEALTPEIGHIPDPKDKLQPPMEKVYRQLGPKALKGMEKMVGIAVNRVDSLGKARARTSAGAHASAESGGSFSQSFGNVTIDARLSIATVGSELVGRVEFGVTRDEGGGRTVRVTTEIPLRLKKFGFESPKCPTVEGKLDAKDSIGITVRTEVRQGNTLEEFYSTEVTDETEMQGIVADDAKLDTLEIRSIQEIKERAGGSIWGGSEVKGTIVRNTVVDMRTGEYRPTVVPINVGVTLSGVLRLFAPFIQPLVAERLKRAADKDFAATVDYEMKKFRELEEGWNKPNTCAKLAFGKANESLTLRRGDSGNETVRIDSNRGGSPAKADWTVTGQENGGFSLTSHSANPTGFHYEVTRAGEGVKVKGTFKALSKAGVAEDSWIQKTDQDSISEISGTFSLRTEFFGSIFEWAGNATFVRYTPAIFGGASGGYKLTNGLFTFTASGKASQLVTDKCSMKGSGQFALQKDTEFAVIGTGAEQIAPYEYSFSVASAGLAELPMIEIETFACAPEAEELEGDKFPYPAVFALFTPTLHTSDDGINYAGSVIQEEGGGSSTQTWSFKGTE